MLREATKPLHSALHSRCALVRGGDVSGGVLTAPGPPSRLVTATTRTPTPPGDVTASTNLN
eukprot:2397252-Prymnesium_polylepis.1